MSPLKVIEENYDSSSGFRFPLFIVAFFLVMVYNLCLKSKAKPDLGVDDASRMFKGNKKKQKQFQDIQEIEKIVKNYADQTKSWTQDVNKMFKME